MYSHVSGVKLSFGENDILFGSTGKKYIDFTSGIFCANIGHANPYVSEVLEKFGQPGALMHSYTFGHGQRETYLEALTEFTGYPYAYLFSAGTEATEAAWKVMRKRTGKSGIIGMGKTANAFHGKTYGAQIMAEREPSHLYAQPPDRTAGVIMEPYDPLFARLHPMAFIEKIQTFIKDFGFMLCVDEIQAGYGRTGTLFGYEHYDGMTPDLVCIGKGQGNGYPISGLLSKTPLDDYGLTSTHGGNPLGCAIGSAVIKYFNVFDVLGQAKDKAEILKARISELPIKTHCLGMAAALVLTSKEQADALVQACALRGLLLVETGLTTVKIGPPLTIRISNLKKGCAILREVLNENPSRWVDSK